MPRLLPPVTECLQWAFQIRPVWFCRRGAADTADARMIVGLETVRKFQVIDSRVPQASAAKLQLGVTGLNSSDHGVETETLARMKCGQFLVDRKSLRKVGGVIEALAPTPTAVAKNRKNPSAA